MRKIPQILLILRLLISIWILLIGIEITELSNSMISVLIVIGIGTDIFDGIIARQLGIATDGLRKLDTFIDMVFYLSILFCVSVKSPEVISKNIEIILMLVFLETLMYAISLIRFKKLPSPHAILSKFWGLILVIEFIVLLLIGNGIHFRIALIFGIFVHTERMLIYLVIKEWTHDIPSLYHAWQLRKGIPIKTHKLFN